MIMKKIIFSVIIIVVVTYNICYAYAPTGLTNNTAADADACLDTGVLITWTADAADWGDGGAGTRYYDVLRNGTAIKTSVAYLTTKYTDTSGSNGVTYTYTVKYRNGLNEWSVTSPGADAADLVAAVPSVLSNNTAVDVDSCADTGVQIGWEVDPANWNDNGFGTRTYDVLRGGTPIATGLAYSTTIFIDTTGTNNQSYTYTVRYVNGCGLSTVTTGVNATDNVGSDPSGLTNNTSVDVSLCEDSGIRITWNCNPSNWGDNSVGIRTYDIYRNGSALQGATGLAYCSTGTKSYVDTTGTNGEIYTYAVKYINGCNLSTTTDPGAAAADNVKSVPITTQNNTAVDINACLDTGVQIAWAMDPDINLPYNGWGDNGYNPSLRFYDVYRGAIKINTAPISYGNTTYVDTLGSNGMIYSYQVKYNNSCGFSVRTIGVSAADYVGANPSGLTNNTAVDIDACGDTGVRITWNQDPANWSDNSTGTRTYDILRNGTAIATGIFYGTTNYIDTTGSNNVVFAYTVRYVNGCLLSATTSPGADAADLVGFVRGKGILIPGATAVLDTISFCLKDAADVYGYFSFPSSVSGNACNSSIRDVTTLVFSGVGVADYISFCAKDTTDNYFYAYFPASYSADVCLVANRGVSTLIFGGAGVADKIRFCGKTTADVYRYAYFP